MASRYSLPESLSGLRAITHLSSGEREFKLAKKYAPDNPLIGPMANLYLNAEEHAVLAALPGERLNKLRHRLGWLYRRRVRGRPERPDPGRM